MKKVLFAVSAIGLFAATPAFAQTAQGEIALNATVAKACGVGDHRSGASSVKSGALYRPRSPCRSAPWWAAVQPPTRRRSPTAST